MKQIFLIKENHPSLLLFFAGWGMDENPFRQFIPQQADFMICYDYSSLAFDVSLLSSYKEIKIVAWSMGVWVASYIRKEYSLKISGSIAVNGTLTPIDDERGIPVAIFKGTLTGLNETSLKKFRRRMCGSMEGLSHFLETIPDRSPESLCRELKAIKEYVEQQKEVCQDWDTIYISLNDKIFPSANQLVAWENKDTILLEAEHYPEELWKQILN